MNGAECGICGRTQCKCCPKCLSYPCRCKRVKPGLLALCVRRRNQYYVPICPICGATHTHGVGDDDLLRGRKRVIRGHRTRHCSSPDVPPLEVISGYTLVEVRPESWDMRETFGPIPKDQRGKYQSGEEV